MEVTRAVCTLKTILYQIEEDMKCDFKSIVGKSQDTTRLIDTIVSDERLQTFFEGKDDDELRKLHFLLFLNTDWRISSALENDCDVGHVVGVIPRLSSRVYFGLTRRYNLLKYMNEILEVGPALMAIELLEVVLHEEKHFPDSDRFEVVNKAMQSATVQLMKTDCEFTSNRIAELLKMLMLCYKRLEDKEDEPTRKSNEQIANEGYKFSSLISLLHEMTLIVYGEARIQESFPLYEVVIPYDTISNYAASTLKSKTDTIHECYQSVFFKCRELMEELDLDMFLTWYEVKVNGTNLQALIGEKVFYLCRLLKVQRRHPLPGQTEELLTMLQTISVKPTSENESVNYDSTDGLEEVIAKSDNFDNHFLEQVERFLATSSLKSDVSVNLLRKLFEAGTRPSVDCDRNKRIIATVLRGLKIEDLSSLLDEFIAKYGLDHFMVEEKSDFTCSIKQIASLYWTDDANNEEQEDAFVKEQEEQILKSVVVMAFQAKSADLKSIIKEGCKETNDASVIVKVLEKLKPLCTYRLVLEQEPQSRSHSVLIEVLKQFLEFDYQVLGATEKEHFNRLILALSSCHLLHGDTFLSVSLLPLLHAKNETNWVLLADLLVLFKDCFEKMQHISELSFPILLVQFAQLLEDCSWSMTTFSNKKMLARERVISIIDILREHPKEIATSSRLWMDDQLNAYSFLTRSHVMKICQPCIDIPSMDFCLATLVHESPKFYEAIDNEYLKNRNLCIIKMAQMILCCTPKEFQRIIENYAQCDCHRLTFIFNWISDSITFLSEAIRCYLLINVEVIEIVYNCLGYLINNFLSALQKNNAVSKGADWIKYINRVIAVVRTFPEHLISPYQFNIVKFFAEELPNLKESPHDFDDYVSQLLVGLYLL